MNHKLLRMLNEAGFEFTPDIMNKLPAFENLIWLEREECANLLLSTDLSGLKGDIPLQNLIANLLANYAAAIRARINHD